ncbi:hypothetical protein I4U23_009621 [Adineta vaga]|nr:hypothetical protein I4U23_009621 [Adineta vaga]
MLSSSSEEILSISSNQSDLISKKHSLSTIIEDDCINQLKTLQIVYNRLESQYLKSVHELEYKFFENCSYLFEQRANIINGNYEPNDEECRLQTDFIEHRSSSDNIIGIPSFWLQTLKQIPMIAEMIEEWDEPLLTCLNDIKLQLQVQPIVGFTLEFHFNEQAKQYFTNEILTKFYEIQIESDDQVLFYEGAAIIRSEGCHINWIDSITDVTRNNLTNEFQSSFFNFFTSPSNDDQWKLANDYQIGHYIRENIITKAILYYTGEIFDEYDFSDENMNQQEISVIEQLGEGEH